MTRSFTKTAFLCLAMSLLPMPGAVGESEIRVGFTMDALTLDPANHRKRETETIIRNMYDGFLNTAIIL